MKLSDVKFEDLKIGDRVISNIGTSGEITQLVAKADTARQEDNEIGILWVNGKTSVAWHHWMNFVTVTEE
jgi:hypothetical protein